MTNTSYEKVDRLIFQYKHIKNCSRLTALIIRQTKSQERPKELHNYVCARKAEMEENGEA